MQYYSLVLQYKSCFISRLADLFTDTCLYNKTCYTIYSKTKFEYRTLQPCNNHLIIALTDWHCRHGNLLLKHWMNSKVWGESFNASWIIVPWLVFKRREYSSLASFPWVSILIVLKPPTLKWSSIIVTNWAETFSTW